MQNEIKYRLTLADFNSLVKFIKEKYNFDFSVYSFCISKRRIEQFFAQYNVDSFLVIKNFLSKEKFWLSFLENYLVKTTELFRDAEVWQKLSTKYLSKLNKSTKLRIWLPDVVNDDELFSLLILLDEIQPVDFEITITSPFDFIAEKIEKYKIIVKKFEASKQNYNNYNPEGNIEKYFNIGKISHTFKKEYYKNVKFKKLSLISDEFFTGFYDLVLFRNRLLYYNNSKQNEILDKIYTSLKTKGVLVLGIQEGFKNWQLKDKFSTNDKELKLFIKKK